MLAEMHSSSATRAQTFIGKTYLEAFVMLQALEIVTVMLVAVAMSLALAHALEFPGKRRLPREHYLVVQPIYYPGFTIGGIAEPLGLLMTLILLFLIPSGSTAFWLTMGALMALAAMHATYWVLTHPVNNFWLKDFKLRGAGAGFFGFDPLQRRGDSSQPEWTALRDRWETSHMVRALFGFLSLALLVTSLVVDRG